MKLTKVVSKYSNYKFVLLAIKLMIVLCEKDNTNVLNDTQRELIVSLDHHLGQMIKNAEMISDLSLAETHALEDFERKFDPLQGLVILEMDVVSSTEKDGRK